MRIKDRLDEIQDPYKTLINPHKILQSESITVRLTDRSTHKIYSEDITTINDEIIEYTTSINNSTYTTCIKIRNIILIQYKNKVIQ